MVLIPPFGLATGKALAPPFSSSYVFQITQRYGKDSVAVGSYTYWLYLTTLRGKPSRGIYGLLLWHTIRLSNQDCIELRILQHWIAPLASSLTIRILLLISMYSSPTSWVRGRRSPFFWRLSLSVAGPSTTSPEDKTMAHTKILGSVLDRRLSRMRLIRKQSLE